MSRADWNSQPRTVGDPLPAVRTLSMSRRETQSRTSPVAPGEETRSEDGFRSDIPENSLQAVRVWGENRP
jgi:hypothetical protein